MREIEFRGKRIDNGEWVYGWYVGYSEAQGYIHGDYIDKNEVWIVDAKTVGQYVWRKDKNGVKIYEGDIVTNKVFRATVECEPDLAGFYPFACEIKTMYVDECEVIGNIHDNPELGGAE